MRACHLACLITLALLVFVANQAQASCPVPQTISGHQPVTTIASGAGTDCTNPPPPPPPPPQNTWQNNGILSMNIDENGFPMISNLSVLGNGVMYFDNAGAGLQMDARSSLGNAYNPTQAGDCAQNPSKLLSLNTDWGGNGIGIPASYGIQWSVQPRNYNQPGPTCPGAGALLPYTFNFAATLGDGVHFPKEGMVIDFTMTRLSGSQTIERGNSEIAFFPLTYYFPLAYWSPDGVTFYQFIEPGSHGPTNNVNYWALTVNYGVQAKAIMICTPDGTSMCLALYSNNTTTMYASRREGAQWNETLLGTIWVGNGAITDFNAHNGVRVLAVGNPQTVQAVIATAKKDITNWGDL